MTRNRTSHEGHRGLVYAACAGFVSLLFAGAIAANPKLALALAGGAAALPLGLFAPAALVLAWIGSGPPLSTWLEVKVGALPALTLDRVLLAWLLLVVGWRWLRRPQTILPLGRLEILMAWFLIVAAASAVWGGGSHGTETAAGPGLRGGLGLDLVRLALGYGLPFLGFFLTKNMLYRESHIRWLLRTLVAVGVIVAVIGILQYLTGVTLFTPTRMEVIHADRATGTLASAPEFGMVVGAPLLTAIVCFLRSRHIPERVVLAAAISIMVVSIVFSKTRAIWLGIVFGLFIAALVEPTFRKRLLASGLAILLLLTAAWPLIADSSFVRGRVLDMGPIYSRIVLTATSLNMFVHNPLFGLGFGRYTYLSKKADYIVSVGHLTSYDAYGSGVPHNEYMHVLILLGLVGFVPYVAILVLAWRTAARHYRKPLAVSGLRRDVALIFLSAFTLYLTAACTSDAIFFGYSSIQVYSLLGAIDGLRVRESLSLEHGLLAALPTPTHPTASRLVAGRNRDARLAARRR